MTQEASLPKLFQQLKHWWQSVSSPGFGEISTSRRLSTPSSLKNHPLNSAPSISKGSVNSPTSLTTVLNFGEKVTEFTRVRRCVTEPPVFQGTLEPSYEVDLYVPGACHNDTDDDQNAFLLFCHVQPSAVDVTFFWSKDGSEILPQPRVTIVSQRTATQLRINFPRHSDSGNYTCEAISPSGRCTNSTCVYVRPKTETEENRTLCSHSLTEVQVKPPDVKQKENRTEAGYEALSESENDISNGSGAGFQSADTRKVVQAQIMSNNHRYTPWHMTEDVKTLPECDQPAPTYPVKCRELTKEASLKVRQHNGPTSASSSNPELTPASSPRADIARHKRRNCNSLSVVDSRGGRIMSLLASQVDISLSQMEKSYVSDLRALKMRSIKRGDDPTRWTVGELRALFEAQEGRTKTGPTRWASHSDQWEYPSRSAPNTLKPFRDLKDEVGQEPPESWIQTSDSEPDGDSGGQIRSISVLARKNVEEPTLPYSSQTNETTRQRTDSANGSNIINANHIQQFVKSPSRLYKKRIELFKSTEPQISRLAALSSERANKFQQIDFKRSTVNEGFGTSDSFRSIRATAGATERSQISTRNLQNTSDAAMKTEITVSSPTDTDAVSIKIGTRDVKRPGGISTYGKMESHDRKIGDQERTLLVDQPLTSTGHIMDRYPVDGVCATGNQLLYEKWLPSIFGERPPATVLTTESSGILDYVDDNSLPTRGTDQASVDHAEQHNEERRSTVVSAVDETWSSGSQCFDCVKAAEESINKLVTNINKADSVSRERLFVSKPDPALNLEKCEDGTLLTKSKSQRQVGEELSDARRKQQPIVHKCLLSAMPSKSTEALCAASERFASDMLIPVTNSTPIRIPGTCLITYPKLEAVTSESSTAITKDLLPSNQQPRVAEASSDDVRVGNSSSKREEFCSNECSLYVKTLRDVDPNTHFLPMTPLGEGQFGKVHACVCRKTGTNYALKKFRFARLQRHQGELMEVAVLRAIGEHPQIAHLVAAFEFNGYCTLITELVTGGALFERIESEGCLDETITVQIVKQMLAGLKHLKNCQVLHCDLKPENLIMCQPRGYQLKIIDFGLACFYDTNQTRRRPAGTLTYLAPETQNYDPQSYATDLWSVAVIAYEILAGITPFEVPHEGDPERKLSRDEISINITKVRYTMEESGIVDASTEAKDFIRKILVRQPEKRPSVEECLKHPWMTIPDVARPMVTRKLSLYRRSTRRKINRNGKILGRTHSLNKSETDN